MASMRHDSTVEEAVKEMSSSVTIEEKRKNADGGSRKSKLSRDGTIINLVETATSILPSLAHIHDDWTGVQASQCFRNGSKFVLVAGHSISCDVEMNFFKSGLIQSGVVSSLDSYDERYGVIILGNATSEILQNFDANHFFGPSKANRFCVKSGMKTRFSFLKCSCFPSRYTDERQDARKFAFVRYFERTPLIDIVDFVLSYQCLR